MGGDYVTLNQLVTAFNRTGSYSYKMISWVENRGLPVHNKRVQQNTFRVVYLKEFWTWAEKNRSFLDFSKLEPLAFGEEPAWVAEQRKRDFKACSLQRKDPWTPAEDAKLRMLLEQYKYTYEQEYGHQDEAHRQGRNVDAYHGERYPDGISGAVRRPENELPCERPAGR